MLPLNVKLALSVSCVAQHLLYLRAVLLSVFVKGHDANAIGVMLLSSVM